MVSLSPAFTPAILRGIRVYPDNALKFDFIVDSGDTGLKGPELKDVSERLIKYFLTALTIPEDNLWVNLSPHEQDRIIPGSLAVTDMGTDMLSQDYLLKQITASLIYPEDELGKQFWQKIYKKAYEQYGTTNIPVDTFNKVWIMPDKAEVYVKDDRAFVVESKLKVMLEEDYLALENNTESQGARDAESKTDNKLASEIVREIVIPALEKEVNEGKNFAQLRQIYNSLILAYWFKNNLKESIVNKVYSDQQKIKGIDAENVSQDIYKQYLKSFEKGVCDFIKVEYDQYTRKNIPRKYFSGGFTGKLKVGESIEFIEAKTRNGRRAGSNLVAKLKIATIVLVTVGLSIFQQSDVLAQNNDKENAPLSYKDDTEKDYWIKLAKQKSSEVFKRESEFKDAPFREEVLKVAAYIDKAAAIENFKVISGYGWADYGFVEEALKGERWAAYCVLEDPSLLDKFDDKQKSQLLEIAADTSKAAAILFLSNISDFGWVDYDFVKKAVENSDGAAYFSLKDPERFKEFNKEQRNELLLIASKKSPRDAYRFRGFLLRLNNSPFNQDSFKNLVDDNPDLFLSKAFYSEEMSYFNIALKDTPYKEIMDNKTNHLNLTEGQKTSAAVSSIRLCRMLDISFKNLQYFSISVDVILELIDVALEEIIFGKTDAQGKEIHVINIVGWQSRFNKNKLETFEISAGVLEKNIQSFKEGIHLERNAIEAVEKSIGPLRIVYDGHAGRNYLNVWNHLTYQEMGEALIKRGRGNIENVYLLNFSCLSRNFNENLKRYLQKEGYPSPKFDISQASEDALSFGGPRNFLKHIQKQRKANGKEKSPVTFWDILMGETSKVLGKQDPSAFFSISPQKFKEVITEKFQGILSDDQLNKILAKTDKLPNVSVQLMSIFDSLTQGKKGREVILWLILLGIIPEMLKLKSEIELNDDFDVGDISRMRTVLSNIDFVKSNYQNISSYELNGKYFDFDKKDNAPEKLDVLVALAFAQRKTLSVWAMGDNGAKRYSLVEKVEGQEDKFAQLVTFHEDVLVERVKNHKKASSNQAASSKITSTGDIDLNQIIRPVNLNDFDEVLDGKVSQIKIDDNGVLHVAYTPPDTKDLKMLIVSIDSQEKGMLIVEDKSTAKQLLSEKDDNITGFLSNIKYFDYAKKDSSDEILIMKVLQILIDRGYLNLPKGNTYDKFSKNQKTIDSFDPKVTSGQLITSSKMVLLLSNYLKSYSGQDATLEGFVNEINQEFASMAKKLGIQRFDNNTVVNLLEQDEIVNSRKYFSPDAIRIIGRLVAKGILSIKKSLDGTTPMLGGLTFSDVQLDSSEKYLFSFYHPTTGDHYAVNFVPEKGDSKKVNFYIRGVYPTGHVLMGYSEGKFGTKKMNVFGDIPEELVKALKFFQKNIPYFAHLGGSSGFLTDFDRRWKSKDVELAEGTDYLKFSKEKYGNPYAEIKIKYYKGPKARIEFIREESYKWPEVRRELIGKENSLTVQISPKLPNDTKSKGDDIFWKEEYKLHLKNIWKNRRKNYKGKLIDVYARMFDDGILGKTILELGGGNDPVSGGFKDGKIVVLDMGIRKPVDKDYYPKALFVENNVEDFSNLSDVGLEAIKEFLGANEGETKQSIFHLFDTVVISNLFNYVDYRSLVKQVAQTVAPGTKIVIQNHVGFGDPNSFSPDGAKSNKDIVDIFESDDFDIKYIFGFNDERSISSSSGTAILDELQELKELDLKSAKNSKDVLYLVAEKKDRVMSSNKKSTLKGSKKIIDVNSSQTASSVVSSSMNSPDHASFPGTLNIDEFERMTNPEILFHQQINEFFGRGNDFGNFAGQLIAAPARTSRTTHELDLNGSYARKAYLEDTVAEIIDNLFRDQENISSMRTRADISILRGPQGELFFKLVAFQPVVSPGRWQKIVGNSKLSISELNDLKYRTNNNLREGGGRAFRFYAWLTRGAGPDAEPRGKVQKTALEFFRNKSGDMITTFWAEVDRIPNSFNRISMDPEKILDKAQISGEDEPVIRAKGIDASTPLGVNGIKGGLDFNAENIKRKGSSALVNLELIDVFSTRQEQKQAVREILKIDKENFPKSQRLNEAEVFDYIRQEGKRVLIAIKNNKVLGFALYSIDALGFSEKREAYLYKIAFSSKRQGLGVGSQLMDELIDELRRGGIGELTYIPFNKDSLEWFRKGYVEERKDLVIESMGIGERIVINEKNSSSILNKKNLKGGIDFNAENMNIITKGDEIDFNLPLDLQNISSSSIEGFVPIIINITPVTNFIGLLGLDDKGDDLVNVISQNNSQQFHALVALDLKDG